MSWPLAVAGMSALLLACSSSGDRGAAGAGGRASGQQTGAGALGAGTSGAGRGSLASPGGSGAQAGGVGVQAGYGASRAGAGAGGTTAGGMSQGGATPTCRVAADCPGEAPCLLQGMVVRPCRGIACEADIEPPCTTSADCSAPEVCHVLLSLRCAPDLYRTCGAACESDLDCREGRCGDGGHCRPRSHCSFGALCPAQTRCEDGPESDVVGCTRNRCTSDSDCTGGGYCIGERCYNQLGSCQSAAAQPCLAP